MHINFAGITEFECTEILSTFKSSQPLDANYYIFTSMIYKIIKPHCTPEQ